jgi:ABC-type nickel/cobalt efflux system permease component RcnA
VRSTPRASFGSAAALAAVLVLAAGGLALAASGPFGVGRPEVALPPAPGGVFGWILAQQSAFYNALSASVRAAASNGREAWGLVALGLAYGVFHAAGPGHGKAVISAYLFATGETVRRGITLSIASALLQAVAAVAIVATLALVVGATARTMDAVTLNLERASYALIALIGAALAWRKGRDLLHALRGGPHEHSAACGHALVPESRAGGRSAFGAVLAVGIRPCTGALIVLVFALAQGAFLAGVAATFAMAIGTAATVGAIATVAVLAKGLAVRLASPESTAAVAAFRALETLVGVLIFFFGASLLVGGLLVSQL